MRLRQQLATSSTQKDYHDMMIEIVTMESSTCTSARQASSCNAINLQTAVEESTENWQDYWRTGTSLLGPVYIDMRPTVEQVLLILGFCNPVKWPKDRGRTEAASPVQRSFRASSAGTQCCAVPSMTSSLPCRKRFRLPQGKGRGAGEHRRPQLR